MSEQNSPEFDKADLAVWVADADAALQAYCSQITYGGLPRVLDADTLAREFLPAFLHWCEANHIDFDAILKTAREFYEYEKAEVARAS